MIRNGTARAVTLIVTDYTRVPKGIRAHRSLPSADPRFRPRERGCGRCGKRFMTTPLRRYFCEACFMLEERLGYVDIRAVLTL